MPVCQPLGECILAWLQPEPLLARAVTTPWRATLAPLLPAPGWHAWLPAQASPHITSPSITLHHITLHSITPHHLPSWHPHAMRTMLRHTMRTMLRDPKPNHLWRLRFRVPFWKTSIQPWRLNHMLRISAGMDCLASSNAIATMMSWRDEGDQRLELFFP